MKQLFCAFTVVLFYKYRYRYLVQVLQKLNILGAEKTKNKDCTSTLLLLFYLVNFFNGEIGASTCSINNKNDKIIMFTQVVYQHQNGESWMCCHGVIAPRKRQIANNTKMKHHDDFTGNQNSDQHFECKVDPCAYYYQNVYW
jgi:hypothetical protein